MLEGHSPQWRLLLLTRCLRHSVSIHLTERGYLSQTTPLISLVWPLLPETVSLSESGCRLSSHKLRGIESLQSTYLFP